MIWWIYSDTFLFCKHIDLLLLIIWYNIIYITFICCHRLIKWMNGSIISNDRLSLFTPHFCSLIMTDNWILWITDSENLYCSHRDTSYSWAGTCFPTWWWRHWAFLVTWSPDSNVTLNLLHYTYILQTQCPSSSRHHPLCCVL